MKDEFSKKIAERIVAKYDIHIAELEDIYAENKAFVKTANEDSENPFIMEWAGWAAQMKSQLDHLKVDREYWYEKYINE